MNISNMSATFIRSDRVLYWRDVKRLIRDRRERVPSRSKSTSLSDSGPRAGELLRGEAVLEASTPSRPD